MVCDEIAVARTSAPLEIAAALVKLRRITSTRMGYEPDSGNVVAASGFVPDDSPGFEQRVRRLLAFADALPTPARAETLSQTPKGAALIVTAAFATTLVAAVLLAPLAVHRVAESIIHFSS